MKSSTVKLFIALGLFAVAITVYVKFGTGPSDTSVDAEDAKTAEFVCTKCGAHFQPSDDELRAASAAAQQPAGGKPERQVRGGRMAARAPLTVACHKCNEKAAVSGAHCADHDVYYAVENLDGSRGKCPKCP